MRYCATNTTNPELRAALAEIGAWSEGARPSRESTKPRWYEKWDMRRARRPLTFGQPYPNRRTLRALARALENLA